MIFIDLFENPPSQELIDEGAELTRQLKALSPDERNDFIDKHADYWGKLKEHYSNLSNGKCWYTEANDSASIYHMEHFRPKKRVIALDPKEVSGIKTTNSKGHIGGWHLIGRTIVLQRQSLIQVKVHIFL